MESLPHFLAFALLLYVSHAAVLSRSFPIYTLNVQVDPSAMPIIDEQKLDLVITRGFLASGSPTFNAAWIVKDFSDITPGITSYTWTPLNRALLVSVLELGAVPYGQYTPTSPTFFPGQVAIFDGSQWFIQSELSPPYIGVEHEVEDTSLHPALEAPFLSDGHESWSPYYYGALEVANSVLEGQPEEVLALQMKPGVEQGSFIENIAGDGLYVPYEDVTSQTVCISTPPGQPNVVITQGPCPQ